MEGGFNLHLVCDSLVPSLSLSLSLSLSRWCHLLQRYCPTMLATPCLPLACLFEPVCC
jgi:hypothetical protein